LAGALDEAHWKPKGFPQSALFPGHFAAVGFVVVTGKMKQAMQGENLDLIGKGMAKTSRTLGGNIGGDGDVAGKSILQDSGCRKGQDVGRLVFSTKAPIQRLQFPAVSDQNVYRPMQFCGFARPPEESIQGAVGQSRHALFHGDQAAYLL
jgi:hypothetical protein